jgi:glycine cleavage system H protein
MDFPEELKYSKEHLWVRVEGNQAVIGISDYAQDYLGDVKAVELPSVDDELEQDDSFGSLEGRKTIVELYAPVSGTVVEVNDELEGTPELINDDPYDSGWILVVQLADEEELKMLMSADDYSEHVTHVE